VRYLRDDLGSSYGQIRATIEELARAKGLAVPKVIMRQLQAKENKERGGTTVVEVRADGSSYDLVAQVTSLDWKVNFFRKLRYEDNAFGRAFLGRLAKSTYAQIILREGPDPVNGIASQFTVFVPEADLRRSGAVKDSMIFVELTTHELPSGGLCLAWW
jgi:hypothetical protein